MVYYLLEKTSIVCPDIQTSHTLTLIVLEGGGGGNNNTALIEKYYLFETALGKP